MILTYSDAKTFYHVWVLCCPIAWTQAKDISTKAGQPLTLPCWAHRSLHVGPTCWCRDGHKIYSQKHVRCLLDLTAQTRREHYNFTLGLTAITLSDDGKHTHVKLRKQIPNDVSLKRESMLVTELIFHYQLSINQVNTCSSLLDWLPH